MRINLWYDRAGNPIDDAEAEPLLADESYKVVAKTTIMADAVIPKGEGVRGVRSWKTDLYVPGEEVEVSTVWLGLDHNFMPNDGPPLIFETMVFGGDFDGACVRYSDEAGAVAGHDKMVEALLVGMDPQDAF